MHNIFKKWKLLLKETANEFPYTIFCDMDGVLVDFVKGAVDKINSELEKKAEEDKPLKRLSIDERTYITPSDISKTDPKRSKEARKYMIKLLSNDVEFWATLPWMSDGRRLWSYVSQFEPNVLTAPMQEGSEVGKEYWIKTNLNPPPREIFMDEEKQKWAVDSSGRPNVLIDDFESNIEPWVAAGGIGILHRSADETIKYLQEIKENGKMP